MRITKDGNPLPEWERDEGLLMGVRNIQPVNGGVTGLSSSLIVGCSKVREKKDDRIRGLIGWKFYNDAAAIENLEVVA